MSSGIASRWPVVLDLPVLAGECEEDGQLTVAAVERIFTTARSAYFELCRTVDESGLVVRESAVHRGGATAGDDVTISVNVIEVYPDRFTMEARVRPGASDGIVATARCSLSPGGQVSDAMRDEFIALAQSARLMH